jgi:hypothetical protein
VDGYDRPAPGGWPGGVEDLAVRQAPIARMDDSDGRIVLLLGATRKVMNNAKSHDDALLFV